MPACTVNRFCASSLQTLRMAFHAVTAGEGDQYIAAGVESVSRTGLGAGMADEFKNDKLDGSEGSLFDVYIPMGLTAENVADRCKVTREQQDEWAVISQNRAVDAVQSGHFDREIVPVTLDDGTEVSQDDGPRPGTTMEVLGNLKPAFRPDGTVTAGNSCPLNDGAAAVLVMSAERAKELGLKPRARIVASTRRRHPPGDHGPRPDPRHPGAAQAGRDDDGRHRRGRDQRGVRRPDRPVHGRSWASTSDKLNPFGGAIALGHPFGMTGARIMTTLLNDLETLDKTYGIESMCVAGGMGQAMLVERLN